MSFPDRDAGAIKVFLQIVHRVSAVVKYGSGERGVGFAFGEHAHEMVRLARTA
jgi:hypothetical protein